MSKGPEFEVETAAADAHPLLTALHAQSELWPFPRVDFGVRDPSYVSVSALFGNDHFLERMLARQQSATRGLDRKGAAAFLITEYAGLFGVTAAAPFVGFDLVPEFSPAHYALSFEMPSGDDIVPARPDVAVRFLSDAFTTWNERHASHPSAKRVGGQAELCEVLRTQIEAHFAPLIERLHVLTHLSRTGGWRLVSDSIAAWFLEAGGRFGRADHANAAALAILKQKGSPLNNAQWHFFDVALRNHANPDEVLIKRTFRQRGGCCRLYTADEKAMCTTCVLRKPAERDAIILAAMRRKLGLPEGGAPSEHLSATGHLP